MIPYDLQAVPLARVLRNVGELEGAGDHGPGRGALVVPGIVGGPAPVLMGLVLPVLILAAPDGGPLEGIYPRRVEGRGDDGACLLVGRDVVHPKHAGPVADALEDDRPLAGRGREHPGANGLVVPERDVGPDELQPLGNEVNPPHFLPRPPLRRPELTELCDQLPVLPEGPGRDDGLGCPVLGNFDAGGHVDGEGLARRGVHVLVLATTAAELTREEGYLHPSLGRPVVVKREGHSVVVIGAGDGVGKNQHRHREKSQQDCNQESDRQESGIIRPLARWGPRPRPRWHYVHGCHDPRPGQCFMFPNT